MKPKKHPELPPHLKTYTVSEAAEACRVDQATFRDWCQERRIEYVRWGDRSIRIRESALAEFLAKNTVKVG